ncbi:MAG TPA: class I SAM-dependent methyltransferase [Saccharofermentans sp.]|nr:class I SAM-dependent methyltransferase [Saccharofermentans sp.]
MKVEIKDSEIAELLAYSRKLGGGRSRYDKNLKPIVKLLSTIMPASTILDIGCGKGYIGSILKKLWPAINIDGIDAWQANLDSTQIKDNYRTAILGDYRKIWNNYLNYDCFLFIDVIEHFEKKEIVDILKNLPKANIIASIPVGKTHWHQPKELIGANSFEAHLHDWTIEEINSDLGLTLFEENGDVGVFYKGTIS